MGDSTPEKVKMKIVEMLYSWTVAFPNEAKINEAYQTLKRQGGREEHSHNNLILILIINPKCIPLVGLVTQDPELPLDMTLIPSPPTRPKHPVFDNEDMGKVRKSEKIMNNSCPSLSKSSFYT